MRIFLIYLAAGNSRRFGANKLLYPYRGKPLFLHGLEILMEAAEHMRIRQGDASGQRKEPTGDIGRLQCQWQMEEQIRDGQQKPGMQQIMEIIIVTRYRQIRQKAEELGVRCVWSEESEKGASHSIRAGLLAISDWAPEDYVLFCVADQPHLTAVTVEKLLELADEKTETAAVSFRGHRGNPVLFSMRLREELLSLTGDEGGRRVLENHSCILVETEQGEELKDIDRPEELLGI